MPSEAPLAARIRDVAERLKTRRPPPEGLAAPTARPVSPVTETPPHKPETAPEEAPATPLRDLVDQFRHVLARLWLLNIPPAHGAVDAAEARTLLDLHAKLLDELGPAFGTAVARQHARAWARTMKRCPWCGMAGVFHDPDSCEEIEL